MKKKNEKLGEIKIISTPTFISKRNKYLVEVRAYKSIGELEYDNFEIFSDFADIEKKRKLKRGRGKLGKVIEQFDKEEGKVFYHYLFYISCDREHDPEDIADHLKSHLKCNEGCEIQSAYAERVKLWPWEKDKVTSRIPFTQEMVDGIVKSIDKLVEKEKVKSMNYFYEKPYSMICGQSEAQKREYKKLVGKSGRIWLVAIQDNPADNIYVSADPEENIPGYRGFRGFGGATLEFELEDGTIEKLTGPWHANCKNLLEDTGYDIRNKHKTFGVVAKRREGSWLKDVLYKDENWVIGEFDRIEKIAQKFANELNQVVYFYQETQGGSSCCPVEPEM